MKISQLVSITLGALVVLCAATARADTIVTTYGDKDGFSAGITHGGGFEFGAIGDGDGDGTDAWHDGNFSFTLDHVITGGAIESASLELFTGGWGYDGPAGLYLNGSFVGFLTAGETSDEPFNLAHRDVMSLTPYVSLLTGRDLFEIRVADSLYDNGVFDYAELTVNTAGVTAPVPEPSTYALLGLGLLGVTLRMRRRASTGH